MVADTTSVLHSDTLQRAAGRADPARQEISTVRCLQKATKPENQRRQSLQRCPRGAGTAVVGAGPHRKRELRVHQQELRGDKWHLCSSATLWLWENPLFLVEKPLRAQNPSEFSTFPSHWQSELRGNLDVTLPSTEQNLHNKNSRGRQGDELLFGCQPV